MNIDNARKMEMMARPSPCEGCPNNTRCGYDLLACRMFEHYVHSGYVSPNLTRVPTRKIFNNVFYESDDLTVRDLRKELRKQARRDGV